MSAPSQGLFQSFSLNLITLKKLKQYHDLPETEKQRLVQYRNIYYKMRKNNSKIAQ